LGVAVRSVAAWIDKDQLKASRTPGGHRRIEVDDLIEFLRRQKLPVPPKLLSSVPKILVVDDEEAVTRWIAEEIKAARPDYDLQQAHDGFAAGELVGKWQPDVVILDLRMPGMDGYEVCRRIKANEDTKDMAVIAVTADHSPEAERRILECGARVCLSKPLNLEMLTKPGLITHLNDLPDAQLRSAA
jgi:CheY-like chemotaxis protein